MIASKTLDQDKVRRKNQSGRKRWSQITQINREFLIKLESVFFKYPTCYTHDTQMDANPYIVTHETHKKHKHTKLRGNSGEGEIRTEERVFC